MKKQVALKDMYPVVNKQQKKKCKEDTLPTYSNMDKGVYYNTIKKEHNMEDEEVAPQIPPHTIEKLYMAAVKKQKGSANHTEER